MDPFLNVISQIPERLLQDRSGLLRPRNLHEQQLARDVLATLYKMHLYQQPELQAEIRRLVPWETLSLNTSHRLLTLKSELLSSKKAKSYGRYDGDSPPPPDSRDLFLTELLAWFKQQFFSWFKPPICDCSPFAGDQMQMKEQAQPTIVERRSLASTVELYACPRCHRTYRFPRYNHPLKLLETRTGRCGEWMNCFAAICVAFNYDIRCVLETNDHTWVEVFSESQQRWLHCDPCEQALDMPLMYEAGWKKHLVYCIAVGRRGVQDTTWAYTRYPEQVLIRRREYCREQWLVAFLLLCTKQLQMLLEPELVKKLVRRRLQELASYLWMPGQSLKKIRDEESMGRQSGSLGWRISRGECGVAVSTTIDTKFRFQPRAEDLDDNSTYIIQFDVVRNEYWFSNNDNGKRVRGWQSCLSSFQNIFRKVEHDWQMVYLSRMDGCDHSQVGRLQWQINFEYTNEQQKKWTELSICLSSATYQNAQVAIYLTVDDRSDWKLPLENNQINKLFRDQLPTDCKCTDLYVNVELLGSNGELAWQHAQLFRQSLREQSDKTAMDIRIKF